MTADKEVMMTTGKLVILQLLHFTPKRNSQAQEIEFHFYLSRNGNSNKAVNHKWSGRTIAPVASGARESQSSLVHVLGFPTNSIARVAREDNAVVDKDVPDTRAMARRPTVPICKFNKGNF